MNERIWRDLVSFNCTTALATGWPAASFTTPFTDRVEMPSSLDVRSWPLSPQPRNRPINQMQVIGFLTATWIPDEAETLRPTGLHPAPPPASLRLGSPWRSL